MNFTDNELKWHKRFLKEAFDKAQWSKDRSTQTGCVIVKDRRIIATGYNGMTPGIDDSNDYYHGRPQKYAYTEHCDRNAMYQAARFGTAIEGADMYLTAAPCHDCCRGIVQTGLRRVFWPLHNPIENGAAADRWADSLKIAFEILESAGVEMHRVDYKYE